MTLGVAVIIGVIMSFIQLVIRPILAKQGVKNRKAYASMQQWLLQSIQGIKEVKIGYKEDFFEDNYGKSGDTYVRTVYKNATLGVVPRFMIEAVSMAAFFIVVAVLLYTGAELESIVPMLSVVAMAAIRLLPSANRISKAMANMAFQEAALDKLINNLAEVESYESGIGEGESANETTITIGALSDNVVLDHISYRYPAGDKDVLSNANMVIHKGESIGIVGTTGAGKTTAVDVLLGLLIPKGGQVLVDGTDIRLDINNWLKQIGYIPQTIFMLDGTIRDNVAFGIDRREIDDEKVIRALKDAAIYDFVQELSDGIFTEIGERGIRLSGGQRQRIGIARALYDDPAILVFDEATSALDNETESAIMDSINSLHGKNTMVIIAHRLTTIEHCDHIYRVGDGVITREK